MPQESFVVVFLSDCDRDLLRTLLVEYLGLVSQLLADVSNLSNGEVPPPELHQRVKIINGHIGLVITQITKPTYIGLSMLAPTMLWGNVAEQAPDKTSSIQASLQLLANQTIAAILLAVEAPATPSLELAGVSAIYDQLCKVVPIMPRSIDAHCSLLNLRSP